MDIRHDPENCQDFEEAVAWLVEGENGVPHDFLDTIVAKSCWSANDVAELCLRLAKKLGADEEREGERTSLIRKGLELARKAERKMRDKDDHVDLPIAVGLHDLVLEGLDELAKQAGIQLASKSKPCDAIPGLTVNLPPSYLRAPEYVM